MINMPKLMPVPIKTKNQGFFVKTWRWITSVRQWRVIENWEYKLPDNTVIVIPKEFIFDGASIPRPLWGILSPIGLLLIPGLIHDFGYRYDYLWAIKTKDSKKYAYKFGKGEGQKHWDKIFLEVGVEVNGMILIDTIAWITLATLGGFAWRSNRKRNEVEIDPPAELEKEDELE